MKKELVNLKEKLGTLHTELNEVQVKLKENLEEFKKEVISLFKEYDDGNLGIEIRNFVKREIYFKIIYKEDNVGDVGVEFIFENGGKNRSFMETRTNIESTKTESSINFMSKAIKVLESITSKNSEIEKVYRNFPNIENLFNRELEIFLEILELEAEISEVQEKGSL